MTKDFSCKGYWKFNDNLLNNKEYCDKFRELIYDISKQNVTVVLWFSFICFLITSPPCHQSIYSKHQHQ